MVKLTLQGKYNYATVFTENIEETAIGQVIGMLNEPITKNTTVAIMPDVHAGKGSTIGTTIKLPEDKKNWKVCPNITGVDLGCLDKDTEILTPNGWLKINEYKNQKILVYNPDTDQATFELPKAYIKLPCTKFFHYINSKGMNQMVSEEHTMLVYRGYKSRGFKPMTLYPYELNQKSFTSSYYTTKTTFQTNTQGVNLTDIELRLRVMIQADGCIKKGQYICMHFVKERKIERCIKLLQDANIEYKLIKYKNGTTNITFYADHLRHKSLTDLYTANAKQLKIIAEESLLWDGHKGYRSYYCTTEQREADFIQYAFNASGTRASIYERNETRKGREHHSKTYQVIPTRNEYVGYCPPKIVDSKDGYKYCFTTTTGFFIARRNKHIFTTGNCSMRAIKIKDTNIDLEKLDKVINENIPAGQNIYDRVECNQKEMRALLKKLSFSIDSKRLEHIMKSCGTLGGGNHYIELGKSKNGELWLTVHTGSRGLGVVVAKHHQKIAEEKMTNTNEISKAIIDYLTKNNRQKEIEHELKQFKVTRHTPNYINIIDRGVQNKELAYLDGKELDDYLNDVKIAQEYSTISRKIILEKIATKMNWEVIDEFESMHNYIDIENGIIRKGATSARKGERLIIPINMRDGSIFATGKGNPLWNYSAPHGAGRILSRSKAKEELSIDDYRKTMQGIYTTSICESTLDEAPFAYKPIDEILENITDTVEVDDIVKPIYNFKAH